jgi:hypothetical protein
VDGRNTGERFLLTRHAVLLRNTPRGHTDGKRVGRYISKHHRVSGDCAPGPDRKSTGFTQYFGACGNDNLVPDNDADWRPYIPNAGASDHYLVVDVAVRSELDVLVNQNAPSMMMKTGPRAYIRFCRKDTVENHIHDGFNQPRYQRYVVEMAPTRDRVKS